MKYLRLTILICALGCSELREASVVGGVSFWNGLVPISIESAAQQTATAVGPSPLALGVTALGANLIFFGTLGLIDPEFGTSALCRAPGKPLETEYSEEIRTLREEIERSKSYHVGG